MDQYDTQLLSIRLLISIYRRNLIYFDLFLLILLGKRDQTQQCSRILNRLLKVFSSFNRGTFLDKYLVYDRIVCSNALSFAFVLYWLNGADANTMVRCIILYYFIVAGIVLVQRLRTKLRKITQRFKKSIKKSELVHCVCTALCYCTVGSRVSNPF